MAQVVLERVNKTFTGDVRAVRDLDLAIADRGFVVLVGPSGCGKTTTLRMIAGLEEASSGSIRIGDRVVNKLAPKDRDIAMVFQNYALYPHMSVYRNMAFGLRLRGFDRKTIRERVGWAAGVLGINDLLDRKPKALSGGQRQRVALGRAIVRQPAAFLFDEPLSNLDAKLRVTTRAELKRLHQTLATTTVYVTHDQEEAMTLGERVAVMDGGVLQQYDAPLNVYNRPANRFVAGFLGMPPMNFVDGRIEHDDGARVFVGGGVRLTLRPELLARLQPLDHGREVVLGVRPEDLSMGVASDEGLDAVIGVVEPLGAVIDVYAHHRGPDAPPLIARVRASARPAVGDAVRLCPDLSRCSLFEPGRHGRNLERGS